MDLKWLTEMNAPSGHEQALRRALLEALKGYAGVEASIDRMGNESQPIQQDPPTVTVPRTIDIKKLINSGTGTKTGMKKETKSKKRGKEDRNNRKRK